MKQALAALLWCLAILSGIVGTASGAYVDVASNFRVGVSEQNTNIHTYTLGSLEQAPQRRDTILGYDPATGVVFYVNQNPWSKFDPLGLYDWDDLKADTADAGKALKGMAMAPVKASQNIAMALANPVQTVKGAGAQLKSEVVTLATDPGQAMDNYGSQVNHTLTDPEALGEASFEVMAGGAALKTLKAGTNALTTGKGTPVLPIESAKDLAETGASNPVVYRQLSAADRAALDAGQPLVPKGTEGTILDHVRGQPTAHISVSETAAGTARFNGENGLAEINVNAATSGGSNYIPHSQVIEGVGGRPKQVQKVLESQEALFEGPIPAEAVRLIE